MSTTVTKTRVATEAKRLKARRTKLFSQQRGLEKDIVKVEKQIARVESKPKSSRGPGRPRKNKRGPKPGTKRVVNKASLREFIVKVMKPGVEMTAPQISDKIQKAGFKTNTKKEQYFNSTIGGELRSLPSVKRVDHGVYMMTPSVSKKTKKRSRKRVKATA